MINYYHKHLPILAIILEPLHRLLRKGVPWSWGKLEEVALERAKQMLFSPKLLVHYDPEKLLVLTCDASPYEISWVLAHIMPDGSERPMLYTSIVLKPAERNYAQIEREGLSVVYCIKKLHQLLYGRKFTLVTDHKPLLGLIAEDKPLPSMTAARLQRWAIVLSAYDYSLRYRSGSSIANADGMSRLPLSSIESSVVENEVLMMELTSARVTSTEVSKCTSHDPVLSQVYECIMKG